MSRRKQKQQQKKIEIIANNEFLVKERMKCECQAQRHKLINNCIKCGRIVCEQEGAGACLFCGNMVYNKSDAQQIVDLRSGEQFPDLQNEEFRELYHATQHKDKLLDYHKRDIHQSSIIDDQTDYYQIADNVWENQKVRAQAVEQIIKRQEKIEEEASGINIQFDPLTRQFVERKTEQFDDDQFRDDARQFQKQQEMEEYKERQIKKKAEENSQLIVMDERLVGSNLENVYKEIRESLQSKVKAPKQQGPRVISCKVQNDDILQQYQQEIDSYILQGEERKERNQQNERNE